jgi:phage head maturation protease
MKIYADIIKVDPELKLVYGYASTTTLDNQGERVSKAALEEALPEYMRFANIREMHQNSAVGVAQEAAIDDQGLYLCAKVVDSQAWEKVKEGVYKGFSIGGKKLEKVDDEVTKLRLTEISLVDRPANPECVFDVFKADDAGADPVEKVAAREDVKPVAAWKEQIDPKGPPAAAKAEEVGDMKKGMWDVANFAQILASLKSLQQSTEWESEIEQDGSPIPANLMAALKTLGALLVDYVGQEVAELTAGAEGAAPMLMAAEPDDLAKAGARNARNDLEKIQAIHDHTMALGADCKGGGKAMPTEDLKKLEEVEAQVAKLEGDNKTLLAEKEELTKRVAELEAKPEPPKVAAKVITKGEDVAPDDNDNGLKPILKLDGTLDTEATASALIKHSLANPLRLQ